MLREWYDEDFGVFAAMNADSWVMKYFPAPLNLEEWLPSSRASAPNSGPKALDSKPSNAATTERCWVQGLHRIAFAGELHDRIEIGRRLRVEA